MQYFIQALENTWTVFLYVCPIYCVGLAIETLWPAEARQPLDRIGFNIAYTALFLLITNLIQPPLLAIINTFVERYGFNIPIAFPDTVPGKLAEILTVFFIADFFYYWFHRFQHRFDWLWAQHKIHHSEYSLNVTSGNRHHWIEEPLKVFTVWLPFGLLVQRPAMTGWLWSVFLLWGTLSI